MPLSILEAALDEPDRIGLIADDRAFTFRELAEITQTRCSELSDHFAQIDAGGFVALICNPAMDAIVTLYALWESRIPALLVHPRLTPIERGLLTATVRPALLLDGAIATHLHEFVPDVPAGCACLVLTSGTTGEPKVAMLSERAIEASAEASGKRLGRFPDDRWLLGIPFAHVGGLSILSRCLLSRSAVVLLPLFDENAFVHSVERHRVTQVSLVPTMLDRILTACPDWVAPEHLRFALMGGTGASPELLKRANARRLHTLTTYGLTECCSQVCTQSIDRSEDDASCGVPLDCFEVAVRDREICVRGVGLMSGYYGEPIANAFDEQGWFRTGDTGAVDADGGLHVTGRLSDVIITGGENVQPAEVERVLRTISGVSDVCVFGLPDTRWGEIVCAALVADPNDTDALEAVRVACAASLAPFKRPRKYCFVENIPATHSGKPDRIALLKVASPLLRSLTYPASAL